MIEDWLDESIGIATRFVYYEFRVGARKQIDQSVLSQLVMQLARRQFGINPFAEAKHAPVAPECCFKPVHRPWSDGAYLVGDSLSVADIAVAALLSP
jgi:glutathione S-transferase